MRIWADFHEVDEDNEIWVNLDHAEYGFFDRVEDLLGEEVELFDNLGQYCAGSVDGLQDRWLRVRLDPLTWKVVDDPLLIYGQVTQGAIQESLTSTVELG